MRLQISLYTWIIFGIKFMFQDVIEVFNNVLDDSNIEGWRSLPSVSPLIHIKVIIIGTHQNNCMTL